VVRGSGVIYASIGVSIAPTLPPDGHGPPPAEPLARQLSALGVWLLVINGIVGAGIFGLPAEAARLAGGFSPWVFVICGALMLPVMLCFAELASHFDGTGGPVRYAGAAFGPYAGFVAGWAFYVARLTAFSANAALLVGTIGYFWPAADAPGVRLALLAVLCSGLTAVTYAGTRNAIGSLGVLTILKLVPLAGLVAYGLLSIPETVLEAIRVAPPEGTQLGAVVLLVFYAFVGFESGLVPAGEAHDPRRDMPRALLRAIVIVTALYFGLQAVSLAVLPDLGTAKRPLVEAGGALFGPAGAFVMMAALVASVGGNLAGALFSTPRITYALALEGALPAWFATVSKRFGTPGVSIVVFGAVAFVLAAAGSFVWLASLSVLTRVLIYAGCIAAVPTLRRQGHDHPAVMRLPGGFSIPALAIAICLALLTQVRLLDYLATTAMLAVGTVLYWLARRGRS
jgi:amino acid transporter